MTRFRMIGLGAWVLALGVLCSDAEAARRCRPISRRCCVGVTHQPCAPAALRAPRLQSAVDSDTECICAFFLFAYMEGYNLYYAIEFYPDCNTGYPCSLAGNFSTNNPDPCPTCPTDQCLKVHYQSSLGPGSRRFKPGTKLNRQLKWNEKLVLNSGQGKLKRANGTERIFEIEAKELADARMLVSFTHANRLYFAKLHTCRIEAQELTGNKTGTVSDFAIGQEIEAPPADQKVRDVTSQVKVLDRNVAQIRVGNSTFDVVTATPLTE